MSFAGRHFCLRDHVLLLKLSGVMLCAGDQEMGLATIIVPQYTFLSPSHPFLPLLPLPYTTSDTNHSRRYCPPLAYLVASLPPKDFATTGAQLSILILDIEAHRARLDETAFVAYLNDMPEGFNWPVCL